MIISVNREALEYVEVNLDHSIDYSPNKTGEFPAKTYIRYRDEEILNNQCNVYKSTIETRNENVIKNGMKNEFSKMDTNQANTSSRYIYF